MDLLITEMDPGYDTAIQCDPNSYWVNIGTSYICECNAGYTGDGFTCNGKRSTMRYIIDLQ